MRAARWYTQTMLFKPLKSTIVIVFFILLNAWVGYGVWTHRADVDWGNDSSAVLGKAPTEMKELEYFHLDLGRPALSLVADEMHSVGDEVASFVRPRGTYSPDEKRGTLRYEGQQAEYVKARDTLKLLGAVQLAEENSSYQAEELTYYLKKDLVVGKREVKVKHTLQKTGQVVNITSLSFKARPKQEWASFKGDVDGVVTPKFKFQAPLVFRSQEMELTGKEGLIQLKDQVYIKRGEMQITARNGDIFLEQANKKLKYFILNDDVKVKENLVDSKGQPLKREAYAERLEGFGQDRMVLSGAPRVLQGKDVIKGYRITMREKMEFIEVEDAMSDVQVKEDENKDAKERR